MDTDRDLHAAPPRHARAMSSAIALRSWSHSTTIRAPASARTDGFYANSGLCNVAVEEVLGVGRSLASQRLDVRDESHHRQVFGFVARSPSKDVQIPGLPRS